MFHQKTSLDFSNYFEYDQIMADTYKDNIVLNIYQLSGGKTAMQMPTSFSCSN
jgi:hypothetical protein